MRIFTLILIITLSLGFLTTAESTYAIPKIFKDLLIRQYDWDVIGPFMERQIPQYVQGAESFPQLKQLYGKVLDVFRAGSNFSWRYKNIGLTDALKMYDASEIELAVFRNLEKLSQNVVYDFAIKIENALRYGVKVGGKPVEITIEMVAEEMGAAAQVEGASAIESAIIGITEEEAVSVLAACIIAV
ncbi:hypothetical protein C1646_758375 [Rhizophagus diaphanus]|nr:hypothetical protein C1646_758375 [Rhizophagus diaphanus] [Rhizophagus sp. MUCL 43196]